MNKTELIIKNSQNQDLLTVAITYAKRDIAKYLLENGMQYKENSTELSDAIGYAALCGDYEIAKYLIDKGVSIGKDSKEYLEDCPVTKMKSLLEI